MNAEGHHELGDGQKPEFSAPKPAELSQMHEAGTASPETDQEAVDKARMALNMPVSAKVGEETAVRAAREYLDAVPASSETSEDLPLETEHEVLDIAESVDPAEAAPAQAPEAVRKQGRAWRMEERVLNVAAKAIVGTIKLLRGVERKNRETAVRNRISNVDKTIQRYPPEVMAHTDEFNARAYEYQHAYLAPPQFPRSIDQAIWYERWQERRTPGDPELARAVAEAVAPYDQRIKEIEATGLYGVPMRKTPWEYRGSPYESKPDDPRRQDPEQTQRNNAELASLIDQKLAARQAVLAGREHDAGGRH